MCSNYKWVHHEKWICILTHEQRPLNNPVSHSTCRRLTQLTVVTSTWQIYWWDCWISSPEEFKTILSSSKRKHRKYMKFMHTHILTGESKNFFLNIWLFTGFAQRINRLKTRKTIFQFLTANNVCFQNGTKGILAGSTEEHQWLTVKCFKPVSPIALGLACAQTTPKNWWRLLWHSWCRWTRDAPNIII